MTDQANAVAAASADEFDGDLVVLGKRASRFGHVAKGLAFSCVGMAVLSTGFYMSGSSVEVLAPFSDLHVPDAIMKSLLSASPIVTAPGDPVFNSATEMVLDAMEGWVGKTLAIGGVLYGVVHGVLRQSMSGLVVGIGIAVSVNFTPTIVRSFSAVSSEAMETALEHTLSERPAIEKLLADKNWKLAVDTLTAKGKLSEPQRLYLDGQLQYLAMHQLEADKKTPRQITDQDIVKAKTKLGADLKVLDGNAAGAEPARVYTMEMAAFNGPWSKMAKDYAQEQAEKKQSRLSFSSTFKIFAWPLGLAAGAFGLIALAFRRRVTRIRTLINPHYVEGGMTPAEFKALVAKKVHEDVPLQQSRAMTSLKEMMLPPTVQKQYRPPELVHPPGSTVADIASGAFTPIGETRFAVNGGTGHTYQARKTRDKDITSVSDNDSHRNSRSDAFDTTDSFGGDGDSGDSSGGSD